MVATGQWKLLPINLTRLLQNCVFSQAKQMMVHLEESIIQAQNRESRILDMSQWMTEMTELLQSRLDADILAGDVPKEYEVLINHLSSMVMHLLECIWMSQSEPDLLIVQLLLFWIWLKNLQLSRCQSCNAGWFIFVAPVIGITNHYYISGSLPCIETERYLVPKLTNTVYDTSLQALYSQNSLWFWWDCGSSYPQLLELASLFYRPELALNWVTGVQVCWLW